LVGVHSDEHLHALRESALFLLFEIQGTSQCVEVLFNAIGTTEQHGPSFGAVNFAEAVFNRRVGTNKAFT
jgi:hypothetical protein